tara:strand:+ start:26801 stop:27631 length:831 start_codon:yes stop_codon:yes gene_type:complete
MNNEANLPTLNWRRFRSQAWSKYLQNNSTSSEIDCQLMSELGESSKLQYKWANGSASATRRSAEKYSSVRGSLEVFDLDLFPLLDLTHFPKKALRSYLKDNIWPELNNTWHFESDFSVLKEIGYRRLNSTYLATDFLEYQGTALLNGHIPSIQRNDSLKLASRGDMNGFTAILALVREAESNNDIKMHAYHVTSLAQALPTIAQNPVFTDLADQLIEFIKHILNKIPESRERVEIDWRNIESQIQDGISITPWYQLENLEKMCIPPIAQGCSKLLF